MMQGAGPHGLCYASEVFEMGGIVVRDRMWMLITAIGALHVSLSLFFPYFHVNCCELLHLNPWCNVLILMDCTMWTRSFESGRIILREKMWVWISAVGALHVLLSLFFLEFHVSVHISNDTNLSKLMDCALNEWGSWKEFVVRDKMWWWSQLVKHYMSRIWDHNGKVNAVVESCAPSSELRPPCHQASPRVLEGLPFLVKGKPFSRFNFLYNWFCTSPATFSPILVRLYPSFHQL